MDRKDDPDNAIYERPGGDLAMGILHYTPLSGVAVRDALAAVRDAPVFLMPGDGGKGRGEEKAE